MKVTELLKLPDLDKASDDILTTHLAEHFPKTRPEGSKISTSDIFADSDLLKLAKARLKADKEEKLIDLKDLGL